MGENRFCKDNSHMFYSNKREGFFIPRCLNAPFNCACIDANPSLYEIITIATIVKRKVFRKKQSG